MKMQLKRGSGSFQHSLHEEKLRERTRNKGAIKRERKLVRKKKPCCVFWFG